MLVVLGSFLPWVVSGSARRDSFASIRVALRLGVVHRPALEAALSVWFLTPLLAALACLAAVFGWRRTAAALGLALALVAGSVATVVRVAPVPQGIGPLVVLVGSVVAAAGAVAVWWARFGPVSATGRRTGPPGDHGGPPASGT